MNFDERNAIFKQLRDAEDKLLSSKGLDYAGNEEALNNFKASAARYGATKYLVWSIYAGKHIDAIFNAVKANPSGPRRNSESLLESIRDARNYLGLLACLLIEDGLEGGKLTVKIKGVPTEVKPYEAIPLDNINDVTP